MNLNAEINNSLLILGHTFPEPTTTAAGTRMMQLIALFQEKGYSITFASTATVSQHSADLNHIGIDAEAIKLNDSSFDVFLKNLSPDVVLFDRYITEEQFGWRVADICPNTLRILDTEDLHFLRKARQDAIKHGILVSEANLFTDSAKRELASILRCDVSLIISEVEMKLLKEVFHIPPDLIYYLPFLIDPISEEEKEQLPPFDERNHFVTIGNLHHAPNVDSVLFIKRKLWKAIRNQIPSAEMHVYGNYAPQQIKELHAPKEGFHIKGWAPSAKEIFSNALVCLAPLQFGAGLKGKLLDAMRYGTPTVTTAIGAEGLYGDFDEPGGVSDVVSELIQLSVLLYSEKRDWLLAQQNGFQIVSQRFQKKHFSEAFILHVDIVRTSLPSHRNNHFIGQILQHHTLQSSKYMSKWIEEKHK